MRTAATAMMLMLVVSGAAFCSVMVNAPPVKSSRNVVITTTFLGKQRNGVTIQIYRCQNQAEPNPSLTVVTGGGGTVAVPTLSAGTYCLVATADLDLRADLDIRVFPHSKEKTSAFQMELTATKNPTFEQQVAAAESAPVKDRVRHFSGTVRDPSGAAIVGVPIEILRKGTQGKESVTHLKSNSAGSFSADLPDGAYLAFASAQGFQTRIMPFEVGKMQGDGDIQLILQVGLVTE